MLSDLIRQLQLVYAAHGDRRVFVGGSDMEPVNSVQVCKTSRWNGPGAELSDEMFAAECTNYGEVYVEVGPHAMRQ